MKYSTALQLAHDIRTGEPLRDGHYFSTDGRNCAIGGILKIIMGKDLPEAEIQKYATDLNHAFPPMESEIAKINAIEVLVMEAGFADGVLITLNQMRALHGMEPLKDFAEKHKDTWSLLTVIIALNDGLKWEWPRIIAFLESHGL